MRKPNVVLITMDALRADDPGFVRNSEDTPTINDLAKQSLVCTDMTAQSTDPLVSHACILTGGNPPTHGGGIRYVPGTTNTAFRAVANGTPTLAQILAQQGYTTAAFVGNRQMGNRLGLDRGFFSFDDTCKGAAWMSGGSGAEVSAYERPHVGAHWPTQLEKITEFIQIRQDPFLLWVHYYDLNYGTSSALPREYIDRYDESFDHHAAKVAYADAHCIGPVVDLLKKHRLFSDTITVLTGSVGEGMGECGRWGHGGEVFDSVLRVPCLVCCPAGGATGEITSSVRSIDILPTILGLLDPTGEMSRDYLHVEGIDMTQAEWFGSDALAYAETYEISTRTWYVTMKRGSWKYMKHRSSLHNLKKDPLEEVDVIDFYPQIASELESRIGDINRNVALDDYAFMDVDQADQVSRDLSTLSRIDSLDF